MQLTDPRPNPARASLLRRDMDQRLLRSFEHVLRVIQRATDLETDGALAKVQEARRALLMAGNARLAATVYARHWQLLTAVRQRNFDILPALTSEANAPLALVSAVTLGVFPTRACADTDLRRLHDLLVTEHRETYLMDVNIQEPSHEAVRHSSSVCRHVFKEIARHDPDSASEFDALISEVRFLNARHLNAGSSFPIYGCIYMHTLRDDEPWTAYLEHIIHECAHHYLFALWTFDPIVLNAPTERFDSPLRIEPRPLSAIYHQMFVLSRVIRIWSIFQQSGDYGKEIYRAYTNYQNDRDGADFVEKFVQASGIIAKHARLTPFGRELFDSCGAEVACRPVSFHE